MFEVGFTEIVLILGLALLVLGPEKLPALAEKVGRWTGRARAMARQLRTQLEHEVTLDELARSKPMNASTSSEANSGASPGASSEANSQAAPVDSAPEPTPSSPPPNATEATPPPHTPDHTNTESETTKAAQ